ncbi:MAG: ParB/RepB/Spo0J family partition protein [Lachnospiraceae bacterium]|nr:ParB/RepB/Spo0J family partition protein [Lachnospiraceae bacterium]
MAKRGLGRGLGAFFGEEVTKDETPVVKRAPKAPAKKSESEESVTGSEEEQSNKTAPVATKRGGNTGAKKEKKEPETVIVEKIVEVEKVVEKPVEQKLKVSLIEPNSTQPRKKFDEEELKELADSIKEYGILQPLLVQKKDSHYEIIAGERRWRAAKLAGLTEVPVLIREYDKQRTMEIALIENVQRADLNPIEEALAYQRLIQEFSLTQEEIATRVSKNRATITNSMRLLKLDQRVQQMLVDGQISSGHARALLGLEDGERQYQAAKRILQENLSVRDVEKLVKLMNRPEKEKKELEKGPDINLIYKQIEEKLKTIMGTKVVINRKDKNKGRIEIEYYSQEELERLIEMMESMHS